MRFLVPKWRQVEDDIDDEWNAPAEEPLLAEQSFGIRETPKTDARRVRKIDKIYSLLVVFLKYL